MKVRTLMMAAIQHLARIPVTLAIALLAFGVACVPSIGEALQFDRAAIVAGELWRLASCHVTHWNAEHLQWDLLMFVVLGGLCELRSRRRMWNCVVAAAASVSILVFCLFPSMEMYRGLSGIDTALFTLLSVDLMCDALRERRKLFAFSIGGLLVGFIVKTAYEAVLGQALFVDQNLAGFELLVWDHIVAAVVGAVIAIGGLAGLLSYIVPVDFQTQFSSRLPHET
jgi:rhomboid family GlyGly-CTERM serine protease